MAAGTGLISTGAKVWVYPTLALVIVGAPALAASWSGTFSSSVGTTGGIVVNDAPKLVESFQGQLDQGATQTAPEPAG